ncbi:hypothetical protein ACXYMP_13855 [Aliiroseovarius sp. CAU 1755]
MISSDDFINVYRSRNFEAYQACLRVLAHNEIAGQDLRKPVNVSWHRDDDIPPLAWLCKSTPDKTQFVLGSQVEKFGDTFFEGVWDGPVHKAMFRESANFFGTGCSLLRNILFTPPRHCFDALYVATCDGVSYVTNSMALAIRLALPDIDDEALRDLAIVLKKHSDDSSALGADLAETFATKLDGWAFYRVMYHNFSLSADGVPLRRFHLEQKPNLTFATYRRNLRRVAKRLSRNAKSRRRKFPLGVVSTISNGYDSTACTAIAKAAGCKLAHTITGDVRGRSDSGEEVGAQLGIKVKAHRHILKSSDRSLSLHLDEEALAYASEFLATSGFGDDVVYASFERDIQNCVVFEGSFGDGIWAKKLRTGPGLPTGLRTAKSKNEFHLRNGTIFVPLPVVGAKFVQAIRRVLRQPDMKPFFLDVPYDRPIPRRIVEEAGGKREAFGQRKGATAPTPQNLEPQLAGAFRTVMKRYQSLVSYLNADTPKRG